MPEGHDHEPQRRVQDHPEKGGAFDREIGFRGINGFIIGLVITIVVTGVLMWVLVVRFKSQEVARDPEATWLRSEDAPKAPPAPRLQTTPEEDLAQLRAREDELLSSYGWVQEEGKIARIPIEKSIELLIDRGLPVRVEPRLWELPGVWRDPSLEKVLPLEASE